MFKIKFNLNSSSLSAALKQKPLSLSRKQLALSQNVAQDMQASIKAALNIPVERKDGKLLRSSPGEAPRRQSGNLRESIETRVIAEGKQITLINWSDFKKLSFAVTLSNFKSDVLAIFLALLKQNAFLTYALYGEQDASFCRQFALSEPPVISAERKTALYQAEFTLLER